MTTKTRPAAPPAAPDRWDGIVIGAPPEVLDPVARASAILAEVADLSDRMTVLRAERDTAEADARQAVADGDDPRPPQATAAEAEAARRALGARTRSLNQDVQHHLTLAAHAARDTRGTPAGARWASAQADRLAAPLARLVAARDEMTAALHEVAEAGAAAAWVATALAGQTPAHMGARPAGLGAPEAAAAIDTAVSRVLGHAVVTTLADAEATGSVDLPEAAIARDLAALAVRREREPGWWQW